LLAGNTMVKFPDSSVRAPIFVPFTITEAFAIGRLSVPVTLPVTDRCANEPLPRSKRKMVAIQQANFFVLDGISKSFYNNKKF
jgi:hypothetical protein